MGIGTTYIAPALNFLLAGSTTGGPTKWGLVLCSTVPTDASLVEPGTASGYTPQTMPMPAAAAPASSVTNTVAATFGPFSSTQTFSGGGIKDTTATGGNPIFVGSLSAAVTMSVGESLIFAVGSIACSLS